MGSYAWYYHAGNGVYYWTYSHDMSTTQFAREVSKLIGKSLTASDISAANRQADLDAAKRRSSQMIYIPWGTCDPPLIISGGSFYIRNNLILFRPTKKCCPFSFNFSSAHP